MATLDGATRIANIRKSDGKVVDLDQFYDPEYYFNIELPVEKVPSTVTTASYVLDDKGDIVPAPRKAPPRVEQILLGNGEPFGALHIHPNDQLIVVLAGAVNIAEDGKDTQVAAPSSHRIGAGVDHLISGVEDHNLILTVQL